jgi:hypothetical protein
MTKSDRKRCFSKVPHFHVSSGVMRFQTPSQDDLDLPVEIVEALDEAIG